MDELDFSKVCRICLSEGGNLMSLFKVSMFKKMMAIASIQVWPNDGLPGQICTRCASKLHIAFQLKKQCERSDIKLRQYQASNVQNEKKTSEEIQPTMDIVENSLPQQVEVETVTHRVFLQATNALVESMQTQQPTYGHFMTDVNNRAITPVTYTSLVTNDSQLPAYNTQGHLVYDAQYALKNQQVDIAQTQLVQMEDSASSNLPNGSSNEQKTENIDGSRKETDDVKNKEDGKTCGTCGKIFKTTIKLNRHLKTHTILTELPYKCDICGKGFCHGGNFKIHMRIHNNERPFKCPVCNRGCRQAQDLEKHLRTHTGERPHQCHFCPKAFATSSNLTAHIRIHTGERPYVCCVCQKAFCQSSELTKHMRTHTGEKSHICDICNKGFNGSSGLLTHRRMHTGERPYTCPFCSRGFTSSNCLSAHIKTHNKMYPLKCDQCEQRFNSLSTLKEHMTLDHNITELIQCTVCDNTFEKVNDYLGHMRTHGVSLAR